MTLRRKISAPLRVLTLLALLSISASSLAQVVECKDKNGKKIFAQVCPNHSTQVREIPVVPVSPASAAKGAKAASSWRQANIGFKDRQQAKVNSENAERDKQRAIEEQCYQNQKRILELSSGLPLIEGKDKEGQAILMDDAKRQAELKEKTEQTKHCKNAP